MRLCRYQQQGSVHLGFYEEQSIIPLARAAASQHMELTGTESLLSVLPGGADRQRVGELQEALGQLPEADLVAMRIPHDSVALLVPVAAPRKLMLLAGNYSKHIEEGGDRAEERAKTFPYVFMKPPSTTLRHPHRPVKIPEVSPHHIDWELELGVIIGRPCRGVSEAEALDYVAGYTVVNDISDRRFRPNPNRATREKDPFFDWMHGKWHDTFCPVGPCVLPADELADPQQLQLTLRVNGHVEQNASTAEMVFPVAAVIEFISSYVTLEPGDVISTGTPSGVGAAKGKFLKPGDVMEAAIDGIGVLRNPVE